MLFLSLSVLCYNNNNSFNDFMFQDSIIVVLFLSLKHLFQCLMDKRSTQIINYLSALQFIHQFTDCHSYRLDRDRMCNIKIR